MNKFILPLLFLASLITLPAIAEDPSFDCIECSCGCTKDGQGGYTCNTCD